MSELKPCPFCGSEAKLFADKKTYDWGAVCQQPECECNAKISYCSTREEAIEQWNRRTTEPDPRVAALVEALRHTQLRLKTQTQMPFYRDGERWFVTDFTKEQLVGNIAFILAEVNAALEKSHG